MPPASKLFFEATTYEDGHVYPGLYVVLLNAGQPDQHHRVVRLKVARDGGMLEFLDPANGKTVGSAGVRFMEGNAWHAQSFIDTFSSERQEA